ncbi:MAG: TVP38/TMEM64 family protein [Phycisphaerales bacterium]
MAVRRVKLIVFIVVVVVGLMVAGGMVPIIGPLGSLFAYIGGLGSWGPVTLCGFYTASCVFLIPASIPTLAAGFLFGVFKGSITAMVGGTVGAVAAFWIGRMIANGRAQHRTARSHWLTSLDNAVGEQGFQVVLLSRLSPVFPYAILNYAFGLTKVSFRHYICGTVIGVLPAMVLYVYVGAGLRSLADLAAYTRGEGQTTPALRVFFWAGLVVTVVVTVLLTRVAQKAFRTSASQ